MRDTGLQAGILLRGAVYSAEGELAHEIIQPGHSFVQAFPNILVNYMSAGAINPTIDDTGGTSRVLSSAGFFLDASAAEAIATNGIVVGTGTTAVAMTDTKLVTQIAEGSGAGQLNHLVQQFTPVAIITATNNISLIRIFVNNSGSAITVKEVGLYVKNIVGGVYRNFCMCRDLLTVTVNAGQILIIQYQLVFNLT